jgi:hypothetical protein
VFASGNFAGGADKFYFHNIVIKGNRVLFFITSNLGYFNIAICRNR